MVTNTSAPHDGDREGVHAASADEAWQESVFLAWYDEGNGVGGIHRIGAEINRGQSNMWCGVFHEGGRSFRRNLDQAPLVRHPGGAGFICGPQRFSHEQGTLRWRLDEPDCAVELEVEDLESGDTWVGNTESMLAVSVTGHFHHHCRVRGRVRLGEQTFEISGGAWRDHSWGPRHWDAILHHRCFSSSFGNNHAIDFYSLLDAKGALSRGGVIVRDGHLEAVEDFRFTVALDDDGLTAQSADVRGRRQNGEAFSAHFDLAGGVLVETREYVGVETVGVITMDSGQRGFGYMAVSTNPRAGRAHPMLAIHAISHDGLAETAIAARLSPQARADPRADISADPSTCD